MISNSRHRPLTDTVVVFWILALFAITALGAFPLFFYRLDLSKLTFSTPIPVVVGIGIEVTAYAPTLAALLIVVLVPGSGGIGRLMRPVVGLMPTSIVSAAGLTTEPAVSVPTFAAQKFAEVPAPELDPPVLNTGRPSLVPSRGSGRGS